MNLGLGEGLKLLISHSTLCQFELDPIYFEVSLPESPLELSHVIQDIIADVDYQ